MRKVFDESALDIYNELLSKGLSAYQAAEVTAERYSVCTQTMIKYLKKNNSYEGRQQAKAQYSFEAYCSDDYTLIENYEQAKAANFKGWCIHHRLETHKYADRSRTSWIKRDEFVPAKVLKDLKLYYNRPAAELIFMTSANHMDLHHCKSGRWGHKKGLAFSENHKQSLKEAWQQRKINHPVTEETRRKMSESAKKRWQR